MQKLPLVVAGLVGIVSSSIASEITVKEDANKDLSLSIYNNTALVRDVRSVNLPKGQSSVLFAGVSEQMKPESVIVNASDIVLTEQNYNFSMLSPENVAKANIGKIVKTVIWDQDKAKNIYEKARILDVYAGRPVLQFGYGIEFDFPGRIIWDDLPDNLQTEPSLSLGVKVEDSGEKTLDLMYLTGGLRWSTNYVAEFINDNLLNLKSWISLHNTSGIDYNNARVQVVAGEANVVQETMRARPVMMMKAAAVADNAVALGVKMPEEESVGEYHVYSLPDKISIANNQTKQVSLLEKDKIKYKKEYRLSSPLYIGLHNSGGEFKKINTNVFVKLANDKESNLGEPLPQGIIRFYDRDSKGNTLFVGESRFNQLAIGQDTELNIGRSFDVTVSGKVTNQNKISEKQTESEVNITFMNAKNTNVTVAFEQYLNEDWAILSENVKGVKQNAHTMRWAVEIPAQGSAVLNFKVRVSKLDE